MSLRGDSLMSSEEKTLRTVALVLIATVLLTGALALYLTLARRPAGAVETEAPSGPRIVFVSDVEGEAALYVMSADGTGMERLSSAGSGMIVYPAWSPDGQHLACLHIDEASDRAAVWVHNLAGEPSRLSAEEVDVMGLKPAWSPDGTRLAFVASSEGTVQLIVVHADGSGVERTIALPAQVRHVYSLAWSPQGDELLLLGTDNPSWRSYITPPFIYLVSVDDEGVEQLGQAWAVDWAPDGRGAVVAPYVNPAVVYTVDEERQMQPIAQLEDVFAVAVDWSPDGGHIVVLGTRNQSDVTALYIIDAATGEVTVAVDGTEVWMDWVDWSPDGRRLLFTQGPLQRRPGSRLPYANLWVYDLDQRRGQPLTEQEGFAGMGVWSP